MSTNEPNHPTASLDLTHGSIFAYAGPHSTCTHLTSSRIRPNFNHMRKLAWVHHYRSRCTTHQAERLLLIRPRCRRKRGHRTHSPIMADPPPFYTLAPAATHDAVGRPDFIDTGNSHDLQAVTVELRGPLSAVMLRCPMDSSDGDSIGFDGYSGDVSPPHQRSRSERHPKGACAQSKCSVSSTAQLVRFRHRRLQ